MQKAFFLLAFTVLGIAAQDKPNDFLLDSSKPYAYLKYDHVGPRIPQQRGEEPVGLWLRIVNNCRVPIAVGTFRVTTGDAGVVVVHEVISIGPPEISIQESGAIQTEEPKGGAIQTEEPVKKVIPPKGYSAELTFVKNIAPGRDLLVSVPRNHVSPEWFIQFKVWRAVRSSPGPYTELDFFEQEIPRQESKK